MNSLLNLTSPVSAVLFKPIENINICAKGLKESDIFSVKRLGNYSCNAKGAVQTMKKTQGISSKQEGQTIYKLSM